RHPGGPAMHFIFRYAPMREALTTDVQRFVDFLVAQGTESVTNLEISCYPWRNGKRLQAVNSEGQIRPVVFALEPGDDRYEPPKFPETRELLTMRERPDELGNFGFATVFDHDG